MSTPRFTPPSGPGGGARRRDHGTRVVSRRMRGLVALAVAGTVGAGALAAQHSTQASSAATGSTAATSSTAATAATSSTSSGTTASQATLQSAAATPSSSASQTPVAASGGS